MALADWCRLLPRSCRSRAVDDRGIPDRKMPSGGVSVLEPTVKRTPLSFASLALLLFAGWPTADTLARTPAFTPSLRSEGAGGNRVLGCSPAM